MRRQSNERVADIRVVLVESFAANDAQNQLILEHLNPKVWRARPPGRNARTIAAIFSHVHNTRLKWLRLSTDHFKLPAQLDRSRCTQKQARVALAESAKLCSGMLRDAIVNPNGRVKRFRRDGWARAWPAGAAMVAYMLSHEAHHRGQVCMLAHQMGFPLTIKAGYGMWTWERLWKQCGFDGPR